MAKKCTIIFKDEVNAKITGLDPRVAGLCEKELSYFDPAAYHKPSYKLGRWDGTFKYFKKQNGNTFIAMLERLVPILVNNGYSFEFEDYRTNVNPPEHINVDFFASTVWPEGHPLEGEPIRLREDQVDSVNRFLSARYGLMCLPTSYGKTITTAAVSKAMESQGRTITIVPSTSLVEQTLEDFTNVGLDAGGIHADRKEYGRTHTITTWQSLMSIFKGKEQDVISAILDDLVLLIVDECHQATNTTKLKDMLTSYFSRVPYRLGLTGTMPKEDHESQAIIASIGPLIHRVPVSMMQEMGFIARCEVHNIVTQEQLKFKDYISEAAHLSKSPARLDFVAEAVKDIRQSGNTLILVNSIEAGKMLESRIPESTFVYGQTKQKDRAATYKGVNTQDDTVIIATYQVAAVGINIPRIFNLITIESGKSFIRVIQSIGRAIRVAKDKNFARIFDISSSSKYSKKHLKDRISYYKEVEYPYETYTGDYDQCVELIQEILAKDNAKESTPEGDQ